MPRNYSRKTDRQDWDKTSMEKAIEAVKNNEMGWLLASKVFKVPQSTLRRHALKQNKVLAPTTKGMGRYRSVFTYEMERELVEHIKLLETRFFGFTRKEVLELAYQFADVNNIPHNFNNEKKMAGKEWLAGFRRRHPDISLRKPEATSAARAQAFNKPQVALFYNTYQDIIQSNNISPHRLYNVDESALSTVQRPQKVFATTGRKQVGALTSAEKGSHVTIVCCMSANGHFIPPCLIYPRKNMKQELIDEAPTGTMGIAQESGWMTTAVFYKWLVHFQLHVKASLDDKVLLIVDGHISHKGIESLTFAKEHGIIMVCLPPHCTHRMQPLDVSFYGPLKTYFNQEVSTWLKSHPGRVVTHFQIGAILNKAYGKAATVQTAVNGFQKTGLWPVDPYIFPDYLFEPAETTNIPMQQDRVEPEEDSTAAENLCIPSAGPSQVEAGSSTSLIFASTSAADNPRPLSVVQSRDTATAIPTTPTSSKLILQEMNINVPVSVLSPVPKGIYVAGQGKRKPRKKPTVLVLTSTPNIEEAKAKSAPPPVPKKNTRMVTKALDFSSDSENDFSSLQAHTEAGDDDEDCPCIYCNDLYSRSKPKEVWLKCLSCKRWAHASCADVPKNTKRFTCELCI